MNSRVSSVEGLNDKEYFALEHWKDCFAQVHMFSNTFSRVDCTKPCMDNAVGCRWLFEFGNSLGDLRTTWTGIRAAVLPGFFNKLGLLPSSISGIELFWTLTIWNVCLCICNGPKCNCHKLDVFVCSSKNRWTIRTSEELDCSNHFNTRFLCVECFCTLLIDGSLGTGVFIASGVSD